MELGYRVATALGQTEVWGHCGLIIKASEVQLQAKTFTNDRINARMTAPERFFFSLNGLKVLQ